jgi:hypothetical protein
MKTQPTLNKQRIKIPQLQTCAVLLQNLESLILGESFIAGTNAVNMKYIVNVILTTVSLLGPGSRMGTVMPPYLVCAYLACNGTPLPLSEKFSNIN